jgi:hypothetical protein
VGKELSSLSESLILLFGLVFELSISLWIDTGLNHKISQHFFCDLLNLDSYNFSVFDAQGIRCVAHLFECCDRPDGSDSDTITAPVHKQRLACV